MSSIENLVWVQSAFLLNFLWLNSHKKPVWMDRFTKCPHFICRNSLPVLWRTVPPDSDPTYQVMVSCVPTVREIMCLRMAR